MSSPLQGRKVVVTRPAAQARVLIDELAALGAGVVEAPLTRIVPVDPPPVLDTVGYAYVIVTSANGARCFIRALQRSGAVIASETTVVAVGDRTARELADGGVRVDVVPDRATGAGIVAALADRDLTGARVLLPRAREGRPELPAGLRAAGAVVDDLALYDTVAVSLTATQRDAARSADDVILTAPSAVAVFVAEVGRDTELRLVTIGPTTSQAVRDAGLVVAVEAEEQSVDGLISAVCSLSNP